MCSEVAVGAEPCTILDKDAGDELMRWFLFALLALAFSLQTAEAVQTCPVGNPRIAPDSRFSDNGNGTITDTQTGLTWKQCSEGQSGSDCSGTPIVATWSAALAAGANSTFAGLIDWRLPNSKEIASLIETGCFNPAINEVRFPNTPPTTYWTSSSFAFNGTVAWNISFYQGVVDHDAKAWSHRVRLVRGGEFTSPVQN
jgi:hypothetical protein